MTESSNTKSCINPIFQIFHGEINQMKVIKYNFYYMFFTQVVSAEKY